MPLVRGRPTRRLTSKAEFAVVSNTRIAWLRPGDPSDAFPPLDEALSEPDGLLAAGGDLSTGRLLYAYRHGIFPWYDENQPLLWWSPNPRCVLQPGDFHVSRRLRREIRRSKAEVRFNTAFTEVIQACAAPRRSGQGTWITPEMVEAFRLLHRQGWAHSIEIWQDDCLAGGLYGLAIGRAFFGESMFSRVANASKLALLTLSRSMDDGDFGIVDCQVISSHLLQLGATLVPRGEFVASLDGLCEPPKRFEKWPASPMSVPSLQ
ncbi:MAG: leucyl/phenylalanyl-tRNA--protein transferase [Gammaproteobacteria bacterium]|nr:leucyl/phenylalanyl-tRNA--protein transferase [Gammaproteobacteria bacterium]